MAETDAKEVHVGEDGIPEVLQQLLVLAQSSMDVKCCVRLLATSNSMASVVDQHCTGQLLLSYSTKDPSKPRSYVSDFTKQRAHNASFIAWLSKHAHLLKSLRIEGLEFFDSYASRDTLAAALRAAAASPKGLHLQSYDSGWDEHNTVEVIKALPARTLTHLRMCLTEPMPDDDGGWSQVEVYSEEDEYAMEEFMWTMQVEGMQMIRTKHDNAPMVAALAALTNLQSLTLHGYETLLDSSPVLAGLSALQSLTKLVVADVLPSYAALKHLPAQLLELEVKGTDRSPYLETPLALGHLTALTRLHASAQQGWRPGEVCVGPKDQLPPNLVRLCVSKVLGGSLQPLAALKSLRQLSLAELPGEGSGKAGGRAATQAAAAAAAPAGSEEEQQQDADKKLQAAQQSLPGVAIKIAGVSGGKFSCHCCPAAE